MSDFLLELLSEEIPARMQAKACKDLQSLFEGELAKAGLKAQAIETYATPRRLALIARGLPAETEAVSEEVKGPRSSAPPQALEGFLRKTGLSREQLVERDGVLFAVLDKPGRKTADVLAEAIPAVVRAFPWPKSMRWGTASASTDALRWVRPLQGIVALLGEDIVGFEIAGVQSGAATVGHRFHHPGIITIGSANDYAEKLRACHVMIDPAERRQVIADGAARAAAAAGLTLVEDEGLLHENAGLTEWPVPLLGTFDPAFLEVPREVIQLTMRTNQKYFALLKSSPERGGGPAKPVEGAHLSAATESGPLHHSAAPNGPPPRAGEDQLAPNFVCVANIEASDAGQAIVAGNQKVLAARLSDAKFFWEHDLKIPLEEQARKLDQIVFHEKLGAVADKVERVAKLARWLVEEGIVTSSPAKAGAQSPAKLDPGFRRGTQDGGSSPSSATISQEELAQQAETAARLAKADLVTGMVGEFPELQGLIGGYLARAQGHPDAVADAVRDHYKPVGQGDEIPTAPVTVAVSLADKLDSILSFFAIGQAPSGSKDPYALRRSALGAISLITENGLRLQLGSLLREAAEALVTTPFQKYWMYVLAWPAGDRLLEGHVDRAGERVPSSFYVEALHPEFVLPSLEREARSAKRVLLIAQEFEGGEDEDHKFAYDSSLNAAVEFETRNLLEAIDDTLDFFADRLKVQQREAGVRHDLIDAVFALGGEDDLVRLLARVKALQAFVETSEGADLLAGYKRAANILKKEGWGQTVIPAKAGISGRESPEANAAPPSSGAEANPAGTPAFAGVTNGLPYTPENEEAALIAALDAAEPRARAAIEAEDFEGAMAALASLRAPVDAFFDKVTVNDPDPDKRTARLNLLARMRSAVHEVADFSKIEG